MRFRILVLEDNPADVELLRLALLDAGVVCELAVIDDGADALAHIRRCQEPKEAPDLAIIDLNLPKHGGLELLEEIRSSRALADLPVVILSSSSSPRERDSIAKLRVRRHIVKPPGLDEFLRIGSEVKNILADGTARREVSA
jgi:CheY-like chemotaxis protein